METSKPLLGETLFDLTLYAADTHANHSAKQASAEARTTQDTCGLGLEMPLANYDHDTQCWRTLEATLASDYLPFSENWPISGMTQNGQLYQLPRWVPRTSENASLLWPTLSANGMGNTGSQQMLQSLINVGLLTQDEKRGMSSGNGGRINPAWAEWHMGFPTGWTDLED